MTTECSSRLTSSKKLEWTKLTKVLEKVTPGSVAENGLVPGDMVLKIGSVNATNITLNEAQDVIKGATNLLQLTIKKGSAAPSPLSPQAAPAQYYSPPEPVYSSSPYEQDQEQEKYSFPDYRIGSGYKDGQSSNNGGYNTYAPGNSPYDTRAPEPAPAPSGYSTLPARSGQNYESFRPVQDAQQNKYPYKATAGIKLQMNPHHQARDDSDIYNQQSSSPVQYQASPQEYQRQTSGGSNRSDNNAYPVRPAPTPITPTYNGNVNAAPQLQRQTSSGSVSNTAFKATLVQPSYAANNMHSPGSDEGPPPPPPPVNYRQPEPYQRQTSQPQAYNSSPAAYNSSPAAYTSSPYDQRQNSYDPYQQQRQPQQQPGMYVDTTDHSAPQYQRQGSRPQEYNAPPPPPPQYQTQTSQPNYYNERPSQVPAPAPYQRQPSYGSQQQVQSPPPPPPPPQQTQPPPPPPPQQYGSPYTPPQSYNRQPSREQTQPSYHMSPPGSSGINSFDDVLQPFENFQNSNYCDKLFSRDNRADDSGVVSDYSQSFSSDTPRSTQSSYSNYSPPQPGYPQPQQQQQNLLQPATAGPPPPAVSPPPPPPPPPPSGVDWQPIPRRPPPVGQKPGSANPCDEQQMPDKVLNTMLKNQGTQKPFSYVPTGMDLKKFKERARQRQNANRVMPKAYVGPPVEDDPEDRKLGGVPQPETGVYKHAQYNSPLKMYSTDNARDAFSVQSGGTTDVTPGGNGTPERRTSDIKESEVYKMCKQADAKGKNDHVTPEPEIEAPAQQPHEPECVAPPQANRGKGLSFRVLQWLTDTTEDTDEDDNVESYKPKKPRNPLLRHNSEDDEMRFSGLHTKADIPSKAFSRLNKLVISDDSQPSNNQQNNQQDDAEEPSRIGNYDEASIRYRGNHIPSPSFRLLQSMAKEEERNFKTAPSPGGGRTATDDDDDDGLPDKLSEEDMVDKRYTGANIPSKSFRALQMFTDSGDEGKKAAGGPGGGPKIKVINRSAAMSPNTTDSGTATPTRRSGTPADNPVSDF